MNAIYRDYDAEALEVQYLPRLSISDAQQILDGWAERSARYRKRAAIERDLQYGGTPQERLDILRPTADKAPVLLFIHGGYWRSLDKDDYTFALEPLVAAGVLVATINYSLCPTVTLNTIVQQVRSACIWVWRHAAEYGGDPRRFHIAGHSAGGHLATMLAATDWPTIAGDLPQDMIKSCVPISGVFDLSPLRLTSLNDDIRMDQDTARRNSPLLMSPASPMAMSVLVGGDESDEFRRQSRDFAAAWRSASTTMEVIETRGQHHFSIIEAMVQPDNLVVAAILQHIYSQNSGCTCG